MKKTIALLIFSTIFMGCVTTSNESIQNLESDKGIVLFNVTSENISKLELYYKKNTSFSDLEGLINMNQTVMSKNSYDIILVKAGNYKFSKIQRDGKFIDFPENEGFTVEPGKITYIGDISINYEKIYFEETLNVEVSDKQDNTLNAAAEELPSIIDYEIINELLIVNKD